MELRAIKNLKPITETGCLGGRGAAEGTQCRYSLQAHQIQGLPSGTISLSSDGSKTCLSQTDQCLQATALSEVDKQGLGKLQVKVAL